MAEQQELFGAPPKDESPPKDEPLLKFWRVFIAWRNYSGTVLWGLRLPVWPTEAEAKRAARKESATAYKLEYVEFPE